MRVTPPRWSGRPSRPLSFPCSALENSDNVLSGTPRTAQFTPKFGGQDGQKCPEKDLYYSLRLHFRSYEKCSLFSRTFKDACIAFTLAVNLFKPPGSFYLRPEDNFTCVSKPLEHGLDLGRRERLSLWSGGHFRGHVSLNHSNVTKFSTKIRWERQRGMDLKEAFVRVLLCV